MAMATFTLDGLHERFDYRVCCIGTLCHEIERFWGIVPRRLGCTRFEKEVCAGMIQGLGSGHKSGLAFRGFLKD